MVVMEEVSNQTPIQPTKRSSKKWNTYVREEFAIFGIILIILAFLVDSITSMGLAETILTNIIFIIGALLILMGWKRPKTESGEKEEKKKMIKTTLIVLAILLLIGFLFIIYILRRLL